MTARNCSPLLGVRASFLFSLFSIQFQFKLRNITSKWKITWRYSQPDFYHGQLLNRPPVWQHPLFTFIHILKMLISGNRVFHICRLLFVRQNLHSQMSPILLFIIHHLGDFTILMCEKHLMLSISTDSSSETLCSVERLLNYMLTFQYWILTRIDPHPQFFR